MSPAPFYPLKAPVRRKRKGGAGEAPPPVAPLVLVAAAYDGVGLTVTLTFDRAVDVGGWDGSQVVVADAVTNLARYAATGTVTLLAPAVVRAGLAFVEAFADPFGVFLDATADSGVVAQDDGGTWAGANGLELPWP
jgi:hypothetical protein